MKPCPLCGSSDTYTKQTFYIGGWVVGCDDCHAESGQHATEEEAIKAWDTRLREDKLASLLGGIVDQLDKSYYGEFIGEVKEAKKLLQEIAKECE